MISLPPSWGSRVRAAAPPAARRGQVLVEFAFIALILYLLLAAIIEFGRALYAAQALQQAADAGARELSRVPLPPSGTLTGPNGVLSTNALAQQVYNENYLVVNLSKLQGQTVQQYFASAPLLNQMLMPLMIYDPVPIGNNPSPTYFRYPGQLVSSTTTNASGVTTLNDGMTVVIPLVTYQAGGGGLSGPSHDTVLLTIPVVEEITSDPNYYDSTNSTGVNASYYKNPPNADYSPFNLMATFGGSSSPPIQPGVIALRINYPFQAATLTAYQTVNGAQTPIVTTESGDIGPYAGADGLGRLKALTTTVRPFRRVLSAQAIFRRELFQ